MNDEIKFIFKSLIKVPVTIMISFAVFNAFAFGLTYFKLLGFSYVVMTTAVENNYIPAQEYNTLNNYLQSIASTGVVDNAKIISPGSGVGKQQYGAPVTVGVTAHYRFIWPLTPKQQLQSESDQFAGTDSSVFSSYADDSTLQARRQEIEDNTKNNITITYTVPGLKYYPDLK